MPRGVEFKIPLADLLVAAEQHQAGWSLRSIARMKWRTWGYASDSTALEGLRHALRSIDAPVRGRIEATKLASTMHGNSRRELRDPSHPEHERFVEHRRAIRKRAGRCQGVRTTYPQKGSPCGNRAAYGSSYCHAHQEQA